MARRRKIFYLSLILVFVFVLSGCVRLKELDTKVGEMFFSDEPATTTTPFWDDLGSALGDKVASTEKDRIEEKIEDIDIKEFAKKLTKDQKEKIEAWLKKEGLNRYGDAKDIYYTGGTPLFNETTGETKERFEYILEKHRNIINDLGL